MENVQAKSAVGSISSEPEIPELNRDAKEAVSATEAVALVTDTKIMTPDGANIHIRKFQNGLKTPNEYWREVTLGKHRCFRCRGPAAMIVKVYIPVEIMMNRFQRELAMTMEASGGNINSVKIANGTSRDVECILWSRFFSCSGCKQNCERSMAQIMGRASWVIVLFDVGPNPKEKVVFGMT